MFLKRKIIFLGVLIASGMILFQLPLEAASTEWKLVWSDEFDGPDGASIDSKKWNFDIGGGHWGNAEAQCYTDRIDNVYQENGCLVIRAIKEKYDGWEYTSGRITTKDKFEPKYGRIEARIKVPYGQGLWPAFWMLGNDINTNNWPNCGEIDIMENLGREPYRVHGAIHGPGYFGARGPTAFIDSQEKLSNDFHVFAIEWQPKEISWYFDGEKYFSQTPNDVDTWVFDHPFFIILNVAVGGTWPGYPDETTVFPQKMLVDYVRVYQQL